jgi:hypothetical protein
LPEGKTLPFTGETGTKQESQSFRPLRAAFNQRGDFLFDVRADVDDAIECLTGPGMEVVAFVHRVRLIPASICSWKSFGIPHIQAASSTTRPSPNGQDSLRQGRLNEMTVSTLRKRKRKISRPDVE